jgi:hypothetical protein
MITQVAILTEIEYDLLVNQMYNVDSYFNPVKDCNDNWIISYQEISQCTNPNYQWVKGLTLIDWCGPYVPVSGYTGTI